MVPMVSTVSTSTEAEVLVPEATQFCGVTVVVVPFTQLLGVQAVVAETVVEHVPVCGVTVCGRPLLQVPLELSLS